MDTQMRPLGITALAFASVVAGTSCLVAAMALLLAGVPGGAFGADHTVAVIVIGALYLGVMAGAFLAGYGFWTQRPWSWAGGIFVFSSLIVGSVALALIANDIVAALVPSLGAGVAIWYLLRPTTKSQLLGTRRSMT